MAETIEIKEGRAIYDADQFGIRTVNSIHDDLLRQIVDDFWHKCRCFTIPPFDEIQRIGLRFYGRNGEIECDSQAQIKLVKTLESIADKYTQVQKYIDWLHSPSYLDDIMEDKVFLEKSKERSIEKSEEDERREKFKIPPESFDF